MYIPKALKQAYYLYFKKPIYINNVINNVSLDTRISCQRMESLYSKLLNLAGIKFRVFSELKILPRNLGFSSFKLVSIYLDGNSNVNQCTFEFQSKLVWF